jgi:PAS domain S-box-containing protein
MPPPTHSFSSTDQAQSFAAMVEKVRDYAIFLTDAEGTIQTWNKAAESMKGYRAEEAIGASLGMLYTEEDQREGAPHHNMKEAAEKGTYQEETWRRKKDGAVFWALVELIAIRDRDGRLTGFCKITRDLTSRKRLLEQMAREKERAQVTLGAIADGVISVDAEGKVDFMNARAESLTGWSGKDSDGQALADVFRIAGKDSPAIQVHAEAGSASAQEAAVLIAKDGSRQHIEYAATAIRRPDGQEVGTVVVFRDVALRRTVETERRIADRRKDEFLAMLAHELRNPLAAMSAAADLLGTGKLDVSGVGRSSAVLARSST